MGGGVIYGLIDPETLELRYVGKTIKSVEARLFKHRRNERHLGAWVRAKGAVAVILEITTGDLDAAERRWIAELRGQGSRLLNVTDGGEGFTGHHTLQTRAKLSHPLTVAHRAAISAGLHGKTISAETRAKIRATLLGHPVSDAARQKMGSASRGRVLSEMTRMKLSASLKGRSLSIEHRKALSAYWARRRKLDV